MDQSNYTNVINRRKPEKTSVQIILNELYPNENVDVPDPISE
jgi:protein-tyrosine phosphatase